MSDSHSATSSSNSSSSGLIPNPPPLSDSPIMPISADVLDRANPSRRTRSKDLALQKRISPREALEEPTFPPRPADALHRNSSQGRRKDISHSTLSRQNSVSPEVVEVDPATTYLDTPIRHLDSRHHHVFTGFLNDGTRLEGHHLNTHFYQRYIVHNRLRDVFSTTNIYVPQPASVRELPSVSNQELFCNAKCSTELIVNKDFEEPRSYEIATSTDFNNALIKFQTAGVEVEKWDVINGALFSDLEKGKVIAQIHRFGESFSLVPITEVLPNMPRLEFKSSDVESTETFGEFSFDVANAKRHVGGLIVHRHYYDVGLKNMSREEAILCLGIVVAAELENKTRLRQFITGA